MNGFNLSCPVVVQDSSRILLAHGEGGRLMRALLKKQIAPRFSKADIRTDAALLKLAGDNLIITTDSFVVSPLFFPGGDIGSLAVYGTVNDLAVSGAEPVALTLALIAEEGFSMDLLEQILDSVASAARECGVAILAGDTKVVPRGAVDGLFINTTGIGYLLSNARLNPDRIELGDQLIVSGPIGNHGIAVMAARESLQVTPAPKSDSASLIKPCQALHDKLGIQLRTMRDATRGGLSAVLHEWSECCGLTLKLRESDIPVGDGVRGVCELLGLDPMYVANEGTFLAAVAPDMTQVALQILHSQSVSSGARVIGEVIDRKSAPVVVERLTGILHPVDEPAGAPLPRIC